MRPNPRLQRTPLRAPVSRKPLGGTLIRRTTVLVLLLAFLPRDGMDGKCAFQRWVLIAEVKDCKSHQALADAVIVFFADDDTQSWPLEYGSSAEQLRTNRDGTLSGAFYLNTYSGRGLLVADRCTRKLRKLTVFVMREGYRPKRVEFLVRKLEIAHSPEGPKPSAPSDRAPARNMITPPNKSLQRAGLHLPLSGKPLSRQ
jgi:hypothetical protein